MINKQSMWFLTLFSLVLILGVYYVTMPNDLLKGKITGEDIKKEVNVKALRNIIIERRIFNEIKYWWRRRNSRYDNYISELDNAACDVNKYKQN